MNVYSCKPSDHRSGADMMCIAILISGICSDEFCIVYDTSRRPSRGNCLIWDSMPSVWAAVLIPQVSVPFLRAQGAQVWGSGHFAISSLENVKWKRSASLVGAFASGFPAVENIKSRAASMKSVLYTLYILQTNVSEDFMVSSVSSPMHKFFSKPWCSLKIFHDDRLVWFAM